MRFFGIISSMSAAQIITPDQLQNKIALLNQRLSERDEKIFCLEEQLAWFKRQLFGKKSEKIRSLKKSFCRKKAVWPIWANRLFF